MAGNTGDIMQVTLTYTFANQRSLNVFYYRLEDVGTTTYLEGLVNDFQSVVVNAMRSCQSVGVIYNQVEARNLFNTDIFTDTSVTPATGNYVGTGDQVTSLAAVGIYLRPATRTVRRGYKFLNGFTEGDIVGNLFTPAYQTLVTNAANAMVQNLNPGLVDLFRPVIVGRILVSPGRYRLPVSQAEMGDKWAYIQGFNVRPVITSMRSRKQRL